MLCLGEFSINYCPHALPPSVFMKWRQARDKLSDERRSLAEVIRQEFAERLVETEEENRRMKMEISEAKARLRLEVERVSREKEEELAEVHQRSEAKSIFPLVPCR